MKHTSICGISLVLLAAVTVPGAGDQFGGRSAPDGRVGQRVSVVAVGPSLTLLLRDLRRQTGVDLNCEPLLARRRLVVVVRDRPLREVMDQIAGITATPPGRCAWEAAGSGYRLREDLRSKSARQELLRRREGEFWQRLRLARAAAAMSPEELVKVRASFPRLALSPPRGAVEILRGIPEEQLLLVSRGTPLDLAFDQMSRPLQECVREKIGRVRFTVSHAPDDAPETVTLRYEGSRDYRSARVLVRLSGTPDRPGLLVKIALTAASALETPNMLYPGVPSVDVQPEWLREALEQEEKARRARGLQPPLDEDAALKKRINLRRMYPTRRGEDPRNNLLPDCLAQAAAQTGIPVIAQYDPCYEDYYTRTYPRSLKADLNGVTVREALERIARDFLVTWDRRGEWIRVWSERAIYADMDRMDLTPLWEQASQPGKERQPR